MIASTLPPDEEIVTRYLAGVSGRQLSRDYNARWSRLKRILRKHGVTVRPLKVHGESRSVEYGIWQGMLERCYRPGSQAYANYGGRGITVCDRWRSSFEAFLADMGRRPSPDHSVDRKDNDGPYSPDNCRWATQVEQANNTRANHLVTAHGRTQTIAQWARELGIGWNAIGERLKAGWSPEEAVSTPRTDSRRPREGARA